jgi:outer membrane protein assembly factor BamB
MLLVTRVDHRRVLAFGVAGLVPAALVTLLLVHQPSIGDRRLYPLLRGPLTLIGLALALVAFVTWATTPPRLSRPSLTGLAWAGVTTILCIGPFIESTPRARLFALELATGDVVSATTDVGALPEITDPEALPQEPSGVVRIVDGRLEGRSWSIALAGERVVDVVVVGSRVYGYVVTPGANGLDSGAIIAVDVSDGHVLWRAALPENIAAAATAATIGAGGNAVVVAGGERIAVLDADDGDLRWSESVASLAKSRGYALPGAVQQVAVTDSLVYLSTAPDG